MHLIKYKPFNITHYKYHPCMFRHRSVIFRDSVSAKSKTELQVLIAVTVIFKILKYCSPRIHKSRKYIPTPL